MLTYTWSYWVLTLTVGGRNHFPILSRIRHGLHGEDEERQAHMWQIQVTSMWPSSKILGLSSTTCCRVRVRESSSTCLKKIEIAKIKVGVLETYINSVGTKKVRVESMSTIREWKKYNRHTHLISISHLLPSLAQFGWKDDHCHQKPQDKGRHRSLREKKILSKIPLIGSKLLNMQLQGASFTVGRQAFTALTGRKGAHRLLEGLQVGRTFWKAIWQYVSVGSTIFDSVILLWEAHAAETVQSNVGKGVYKNVLSSSGVSLGGWEQRGKKGGKLELGTTWQLGSHHWGSPAWLGAIWQPWEPPMRVPDLTLLIMQAWG